MRDGALPTAFPFMLGTTTEPRVGRCGGDRLPAELPFQLGQSVFATDGTLNLTPARTPGLIDFDPLIGGRITTYRFDLLDRDETPLGELASVAPQGGYMEWHAYAAVKGGGSLPLIDRGVDIDFLNDRIKVTALLAGPAADPTPVEVPLGIYLPAAPNEAWTGLGRRWDVELADKCSILDQTITTDLYGNPRSYVAPMGTNVIDRVRAIITSAGESIAAIEPSDVTLPNALVWEPDATILTILNDMLQAAGFFALSVDGQGQFRTAPFVALQDRPILYESSAPLGDGPNSLRAPEWSRERDIYSIPNRYVAISQGDGEAEAMFAVAVNMNPNSPFSVPSRNRFITRVTTGVEAVDLATLQSFAQRGLAQASSVTSGITTSHMFLPDMQAGSIVRFVDTRDGTDLVCHTTVLKVPFDSLALCTSDLREVVTS